MTTPLYTQDETKKKIEGIQQRLVERQRSDMRKVLNTSEGRRVVWRIMSSATPFQTPYAGAGQDSMTFLNIGKKEFALTLYGEIKASHPELLLAMEREAANDKLLHDAELKGDPEK